MSTHLKSENLILPAYKDEVGQALMAARMVIQQDFLDVAADLPIVPFEKSGIRPMCLSDTVRVYNITKVVYDRREDALTNLLNVYSSFGHDYGLSLIIKSDSSTTQLYLAVRSYLQKKLAFDGGAILNQAIEGHFSGTSIELLEPEAAQTLLGYASRHKTDASVAGFKEYTHQGNWGLSAAVAVPGLKDEGNMSFTQGIERFMDAMEGKTYIAVIIAEPFSKLDIATVQNGYENMLSLLSAIGKRQITISENRSHTLSSAISENISLSLMDSLSQTQTHTVGDTNTLATAISQSESISNTASATTSDSTTNSSSTSWNLSCGVCSQSSNSTASSTKTVSNTNSRTNAKGSTATTIQTSSAQQNISSGRAHNTAQTTQVGESTTDTSSTTAGIGTSAVIDLRNVHVERLMEKIGFFRVFRG